MSNLPPDNGGPNGRPKRVVEALTPKMKQALPIIAAAKSVHFGVRLCIRMKIIGTEEYYYRKWARHPTWIEALDRERTRLQGELQQRVRQALRTFETHLVNEMLAVALSREGPLVGQKMRAIEDSFALMQFPEMSRGSKVDVSVTQAIVDKQRGFAQRVAEIVERRNEQLRSRLAALTEEASDN